MAENEIDMDALAAALGGDDDPPMPEIEERPEPEAEDEEVDLEEAKAELDEGDEEESEEKDEEPVLDALTLIGPDGEPKRVKLDDLLKDTLHEIEVDGEKRQVSYDELRKGHMLQEDYTRKTQEVAAQRDELAPYADMVAYAKSDPRFVQYMQAYFVHGADPVAGLSKYGNVSDDQLSAMLGSDDPDDLARAREIAKERAEVRKTLAQREQQMQRVTQEKMQMYQHWAASEDQRARSLIPDYDNALKGYDAYLADYGFAPQEIQSLADHRLKRVLADALKVRRLEEKSTSPKSELAAKRKQPRPSRSISSGRGKPENSVQTRSRKSEARARSTGRTEDWADVIGDRLGLK